MDRLVEWVTSWPEKKVAPLLLQEMALCHAWSQACQHDLPRRRTREAIAARIGFWQGCRVPHTEVTAGRRHQMLLREAIQMLQDDQHRKLDGDQIAFLCGALEIIDQCVDASGLERVQHLIAPHIDILKKCGQSLKPSTGLAAMSKRILYASEQDIQNAPQRATRLLAGIEMPCRGPVFVATSHLRVLGDVPDDCTIVVEDDGHCTVDGYVMGRVMVKSHCEVRGNISGVVIVLRGDIRARSVINNALVVAKMGNVFVGNAQGPKLIFAAKSIEVSSGTMLGHYVTREMTVADEVRGGRVQVTGQVSANHFKHLANDSLAIVLRSELSCEDFGEVSGANLNKLLSEAYQLRRRVRNFETIAEISQHEAEHSAQSVLMYLFGGSETQKKLEELVAMHSRLNLITRMITNLTQSILDAEQGFEQRGVRGAASGQGPELLGLDVDGPIDADLVRQKEDVIKLQRSLNARARDLRETASAVKQAADKLGALRKEHAALEVALESKEKEFHAQGEYEKLLAGSSKGETKLQVLQKVLPVLRKQSPDGSIASRMRSAFVKLALRNIERRVRYIRDYTQRAADSRNHFQTLTEQLGKDYQVRVVENPDDDAPPARALGRFDEGVKIYMGMYVDDDSELPEDRIITTKAEDGHRIFMRPTSGTGFRSR